LERKRANLRKDYSTVIVREDLPKTVELRKPVEAAQAASMILRKRLQGYSRIQRVCWPMSGSLL
jgi:hypothetical protein